MPEGTATLPEQKSSVEPEREKINMRDVETLLKFAGFHRPEAGKGGTQPESDENVWVRGGTRITLEDRPEIRGLTVRRGSENLGTVLFKTGGFKKFGFEDESPLDTLKEILA